MNFTLRIATAGLWMAVAACGSAQGTESRQADGDGGAGLPDGRPGAPGETAASAEGVASDADAATRLSAPIDDSGAPESIQQSLSDSRTTAIVRAARNVAPAVVTIAVRGQEQVRQRTVWGEYLVPRETQGLGSGFIIDQHGSVLTNHHVVEGATEILVTLPDIRDFNARLVGSDPRNDIAVLALEGASNLPVAPIGTSSDLMIGEWTVAIGNPFGGLLSNPEPSVTAGVVSALDRHIVPKGYDEEFHLGMIQTDAAINPGNSGGPLVNALGEVIGINSSILSRSGGSDGLGFAIPIDRALRIASDLLEYGEVRRAWLGMEVNAVEADDFGRSRGVRIVRVVPGSPAATAGIRAGSRLVRAGGTRMATPLDFEAVKLGLHAGDRIELEVEGRVPVLLETTALPSVVAEPTELLRDLEVVTVTPAIRSERRLASSEGALVISISPALSRRIGLVEGDVVLGLNDTRLRTAQEVADALRRTQQSRSRFTLVFERNGRMVRTGFLRWS